MIFIARRAQSGKSPFVSVVIEINRILVLYQLHSYAAVELLVDLGFLCPEGGE